MRIRPLPPTSEVPLALHQRDARVLADRIELRALYAAAVPHIAAVLNAVGMHVAGPWTCTETELAARLPELHAKEHRAAHVLRWVFNVPPLRAVRAQMQRRREKYRKAAATEHSRTPRSDAHLDTDAAFAYIDALLRTLFGVGCVAVPHRVTQAGVRVRLRTRRVDVDSWRQLQDRHRACFA